MGSAGDFSANTIAAAGAFTLDGAVATTGSVVLSDVTAGGNLTFHGSITGSITTGNINTLGNITIDATTFGGSMDVTTATASGRLRCRLALVVITALRIQLRQVT